METSFMPTPFRERMGIQRSRLLALTNGQNNTDWEGLKSTAIQNPKIRYLHRILANIICGRENTGNVNSRDLFLIYCALSETKVNPTPFLLAHFQSTSVRTKGPICVGGFITSIALSLNLGTELATLEPLETPFVDLDYCRSMRLIKNKPDRKYFLMIRYREVRGVTLPCAAHIDVRMSDNWICDLNTHDPDHMEQDASHNGTHVSQPEKYSTSSRYQPCEEYDYTVMRTSLDDVLSELRHRNDDDVDCDVLLKHIQRQQEEMRVTIEQIIET
ncbi:hypothetical protein KIW84_045362 [Lathyrus oleraceus]|uniref:Arabidopsis retrotransposon Orf1 C-terminal domain-containing protein n=1 Tax=Pisum sativum TaxID=3888 RepID=A0A9D4XN28_PEA|nr:hypothetical protein KIW84_045362 [Pisum sativum]